MLVALEKGYFQEAGLDVEVTMFDSGKVALETLLNDGGIDIVNVAQTPIVAQSFLRQDFSVLSGISFSHNDAKVLIRTDRGIGKPEDLRGKKIGVTNGTTGHYLLGLFLARHDMSLRDVRTFDFPASELPEALASGKVDAISSWEPYVYLAANRLAGSGAFLATGNTFRSDYYVVAMNDWIVKNPDASERYLSAIVAANRFISENPSEAQTVVARMANLPREYIRSIWSDYSYELFLDQAILLTFEQQARWMLANELVTGTMPRNYLEFIRFDALEKIDERAVRIIR